MGRFRRQNNRKGKVTYGASFRKTNSKGKFKKGTLIKYKYQNGRRVGAVRARGGRRGSRR